MKKIQALTLFLAFSLTGCFFNDDEDVDIDPYETCTTTTQQCTSYQACANSKGEAWYVWRGTKYPCSGADCNAAATKLVNDIIAYCK